MIRGKYFKALIIFHDDFQFYTSHFKKLCLLVGSSRGKKEGQPAVKSLFAACKVLQSTPFHTVNYVDYYKEACHIRLLQ